MFAEDDAGSTAGVRGALGGFDATPMAPVMAIAKPAAAIMVNPGRTWSCRTTTPTSEDSAVFVVNTMAVTTVAVLRCNDSAKDAAAAAPLSTIAQAEGWSTHCHTVSGGTSVRADTPTTQNPSPAPNASTGGAHGTSRRMAYPPVAAIRNGVTSRMNEPIPGRAVTGLGAAATPSIARPTAPMPSIVQPAAGSLLPRIAEIVAVMPTLNASIACTRNSGRWCNATAASTKPSKSTQMPRK